MSSWIPSLFNPFSDDDDNPTSSAPSSPNKPTPKSPSSGAKDDLSAVLRGVAAFLAPLPTASNAGTSSSETVAGIKNDLAEIQGSFRSGLSLISSRITSNLLQFGSQLNDGGRDDGVDDEEAAEEEEEDDDDAVGITEEVVDFVRKLSGRPELWTDFPLALADDFHMSDYQRDHAANIEHLIPEFVQLRQKVCSQISDAKFWLIYFILLLPRLTEEDSKLLSTPEVVESRETLLKKLQNKTDVAQEASKGPKPSDSGKDGDQGYAVKGDESTSQQEHVSAETVKAAKLEGVESASLQKHVSTETVSSTKPGDILDEKGDVHLSEEVDASPSMVIPKQSENEEDVSFSDLEDDDSDLSDKLRGLVASKVDKVSRGQVHEWVQLNETSGGANQKTEPYTVRDKESEGEESNDWLTVDDTDFDNFGAA